ncbi:MAG: amidohydrolase family protein [Candidatus Kerfeldbacteria bacterium]|nr:amidohydrolase family protein [Candidatus Kerfeldbacteria bacterium]
MISRSTQLISTSLFLFSLSVTTVTAATDDCIQTITPADDAYTGILIDTHFHIPQTVDAAGKQPELGKNITLAEIACTLKAEGTKSVFAFFPVYEDFDYEIFIKEARRAEANYPKRFVPFLMPPTSDDDPPTANAKTLKQMLNSAPGLFQGYGEIGLYSFNDGPQYPPTAQIFKNIYPVVRNHNLMVYFHPGQEQSEEFAQTLAAHPNINFIVHGDQIQPYIDELMNNYDNIYYSVDMLYGDQYLLRPEVTKQEFLDAVADTDTLLQIDWATWKPLIEAHPTRFMWSTDRGDAVWTFDQEVGETLANHARAFIAGLDPAAQELFAYKNARRLMRQTGLGN